MELRETVRFEPVSGDWEMGIWARKQQRGFGSISVLRLIIVRAPQDLADLLASGDDRTIINKKMLFTKMRCSQAFFLLPSSFFLLPLN